MAQGLVASLVPLFNYAYTTRRSVGVQALKWNVVVEMGGSWFGLRRTRQIDLWSRCVDRYFGSFVRLFAGERAPIKTDRQDLRVLLVDPYAQVSRRRQMG